MAKRTGSGPAVETSLDHVWQVPDGQVASGRIPGYVGAVRIGGRIEVRAGGRRAVEPRSPPMREDTLFRIASVTKPIGGALTLSLVQDGVLALDDPIARWLPEAASPRVLVSPDAPLDRTTEARRPITVRHLLTMTSGWGAVLEETPLQAAMIERGVFPGPLTPQMSGDEFVARVADLPLAFQPGEGWLYDTGIDLLGVLLVAGHRAGRCPTWSPSGSPGRWAWTSTGFWARDADAARHRLPARARRTRAAGPAGRRLRPPAELRGAELGAGVDRTRCPALLLRHGGRRRQPVLSAESVALMTTDALTDAQRRQARPFVGPGASWGLATGGGRRGGRAVDGAGPLGLGRRDGDDRVRRPGARHRRRPADPAGDDRPARRLRRLLDGGGRRYVTAPAPPASPR